jgi:predicted amidohydrolase
MSIVIDAWVELGSDAGRGNLVGIQPTMMFSDYRSAGSFYAALDRYFAAAMARGWLGPQTIVVLPEYLGTWLVAVDAPATLFRSTRLARALARLALRHAGAFAAGFLRAPTSDRVKYALFRARAGAMAAAYTEVFAALARRYRITIVAGSILLPAPHIRAGRVVGSSGALENIAAVFHPNGLADDQLARKHFLTSAEQPFIAPAPRVAPPVYATPAGRLAVLVCADAFYPASYAALAAREVQMLAVPSYLETSNIWQQPWPGYNGSPPPADVDLRDVGAITERQAWLRYGMAGRIAAAGIPYGINVFLRGTILDLGSDGTTLLARHDEAAETPLAARSALASVWLS